METIYELKNKRLLMPIKLITLVLAMALFGFESFAQTKSVKVANDAQLIEAMENPSIGTIELAPGYYAYLDVQAGEGSIVVKYQNGNRSSSGCTYRILGANWCYNPTDVHYPPVGPSMTGYSYGEARAGVDNTTCVNPPVNCCPTDGSGRWSVTLMPAGADVIFYDTTLYYMDFWVSKPGKYKFKYSWDPAVNPLLNEFAEVETEYNFFGPADIELEADDACGTSTTFDFVLTPGYDPNNTKVITWTLDDYPFGNPVAFSGPSATAYDVPLNVPCCGIYILTVNYTAFAGCVTSIADTIYFSCEVDADAGEDAYVCYDNCFTLVGNSGLGDHTCSNYTYSDNYAYSFNQLSGPASLVGLPAVGNTGAIFETEVCLPTADPCPYGVYEIAFMVRNGLCYDEDEMLLTFYEAPTANAGLDQELCATECFTLAAVPYEYCGVEGVNYWSHRWWTLVEKPGDCDVTFDPLDPTASVCVSGCECIYGTYIFQWHEVNVKIAANGDTLWSEEYCYATDRVAITIHQNPEPGAGDDQFYCESDINGQGMFIFALDGTVDELCNENMAYTYHWSVVSQPGDCDITFTPDVIDPTVYIDNCDPCQYGEYVFMLTQQNGYLNDQREWVSVCEGTDMVSVWIFEQPVDVDAGDDLYLCNTYAFSLNGTGAAYCGAYTVNFFNWYEWTLVSQPEDAGCEVNIVDANTLTPSVSITSCTGECPYGEFVFRLTEYNGTAAVYCEDYDEVSVFIFEQPEADAGEDIEDCVLISMFSPNGYAITMNATFDYCYTMTGLWTKSCGPGDVIFSDENDPNSLVTFLEPGKYIFKWTETNGAEDCESEDEVVVILLEQPVAAGDEDHLIAECDYTCLDLGLVGIDAYTYFGTDEGECPNYGNFAHWSLVSGPPSCPEAGVTFADDTDPATTVCVTMYGAYTIRWNEINRIDDVECVDYFDVFIEFYKTPDPFAGDDDQICAPCYTLVGVPDLDLGCYDLGVSYLWVSNGRVGGGPREFECGVYFADPESPVTEVCITDDPYGTCYGTYEFVFFQFNGDQCVGNDTVLITFDKMPEPVNLCFDNYSNCDYGYNNGYDFTYYGCLAPGDVLEVCAEGCTYFQVTPWCCYPGFDPFDPVFQGWTFEWSVTGPYGMNYSSGPGYYDFENGFWHYPWLDVCWGECCDTARIYLTITTPDCEITYEYKVYVHHKPCAEIQGPEGTEPATVAEVNMEETYCNCYEPEPNPCLLYTWTVEHCGIITGGQGTQCVDVLWTDYNVNGGWGKVTVTVFDICTGCCNYDELDVKVYPAGTLGDATLSGYVKYMNSGSTPLNGVEIQLWNGGIPVMSTTSFNDIEGGNGVGYFEFQGVNAAANFDFSASYDAPWYGANSTDALAVELRVVGSLPGSFVLNGLVEEAMNVNWSATPAITNGISATDALWIKQRAIGMVNYFPAGNWVYDTAVVLSAATNPNMVYLLNAGDANRSNIPNSMKAVPAIDLITDGTMNVVSGEEFILPIRVADANLFGAMTLNLGFDATLIEVIDVVTVDGMLSNIADNNVSIAWSNVNPMNLSANDVVLNLKVRTVGEVAPGDKLFSIGVGSEFADATAKVIEPVTLKTLGVTTSPAPADFFLSSNRPNPFSTSTFIDYTLPETGKVRLSVLDMLGQEIAVLVESTQTAGSYTVEFSAAGLATGVYVYKFAVDGETRDFISTQRMIISH